MKTICIFFTALALVAFAPKNGLCQVQVANHDDYFKGGANTNSEENVIKFGLFHLFCGELPFFYERRINDKISVEACAGVTLRYMIQDFINEIQTDSTAVKSESGFDAITYKLGYVLKADLRYYPKGEMPEGFYISPQIRYKVYNISYNNILLSPQSNINYVEGSNYPSYMKYLDIMAVGGYQVIAADGPITWDFYAGIGLRSRSYEQPTAHSYTTALNYTAQYYTFAPKTDAVLYIPFGVLIGVAFD